MSLFCGEALLEGALLFVLVSELLAFDLAGISVVLVVVSGDAEVSAGVVATAEFSSELSVDFSDVLLSETLSSDGILLSDEEDEEVSARLRLLPPDFSLPQPTAENVRIKDQEA